MAKAMEVVSERGCQRAIEQRWSMRQHAHNAHFDCAPRIPNNLKYYIHQIAHFFFVLLLSYDLINVIHPYMPTLIKCQRLQSSVHYPMKMCDILISTTNHTAYNQHLHKFTVNYPIEIILIFCHYSIIINFYTDLITTIFSVQRPMRNLRRSILYIISDFIQDMWYKRRSDFIQVILSSAFILVECIDFVLLDFLPDTTITSILCWVVLPYVRVFAAYALFMFASLRCLGWMKSDRFLASVLVMFRKTLSTLGSFMFILAVIWFTYAVNMIALSNYDGTFLGVIWQLFQNGAFEMFGEPESENKIGNITSGCSEIVRIDWQGEWGHVTHADVGCWLRQTATPLLLYAYLLVTSLLVINLLTAFITTTYDTEREHADFYWAYAMYERTLEYEGKSRVPPQLALLLLVPPLLVRCAANGIRKLAVRRETTASENVPLQQPVAP